MIDTKKLANEIANATFMPGRLDQFAVTGIEAFLDRLVAQVRGEAYREAAGFSCIACFKPQSYSPAKRFIFNGKPCWEHTWQNGEIFSCRSGPLHELAFAAEAGKVGP